MHTTSIGVDLKIEAPKPSRKIAKFISSRTSLNTSSSTSLKRLKHHLKPFPIRLLK